MQILIINIGIVFLIGLFVYLMPTEVGKKNRLFLFVSFVVLWYVHSMVDVYSVPDLDAYEDYFQQSSKLTFYQAFVSGIIDRKIEVGYIILFRLVGYITSNFQVFLALYSFVLLFIYYKLIEKESPFVFCSVALLLVVPYNQSIFVIRQHLALAILLASFPFIRDRKLIKFLLMVALASLMHRTAIIFGVVYFIYGIQGKKTKSILIAIGAIAVFFFIAIAGYIGSSLGVYQTYLESEEGQNATGIIISGTLLATTLIIMKRDVWKEGINRFSFVLIFLYFILCIGGLGFNPTGRLSVYFSVGTVFLIPISMKYIPSKEFRFLYFIVVFSLYFYMAFFRSSAEFIKDFELVPLLN